LLGRGRCAICGMLPLVLPIHLHGFVTGLALGLLALALYLPSLSGVFRFAPLPPAELAMAVGFGLASVLWFQLLKLGPLTQRLVWGAVAFAGAAAVVASLALTPWLNLQPCHLCVFQRLLGMAIAVLALIAAVGVRGRWLPAVLTLGLAALGLAVAGYQSWVQFQPPNTVSCGACQLGLIACHSGRLRRQYLLLRKMRVPDDVDRYRFG